MTDTEVILKSLNEGTTIKVKLSSSNYVFILKFFREQFYIRIKKITFNLISNYCEILSIFYHTNKQWFIQHHEIEKYIEWTESRYEIIRIIVYSLLIKTPNLRENYLKSSNNYSSHLVKKGLLDNSFHVRSTICELLHKVHLNHKVNAYSEDYLLGMRSYYYYAKSREMSRISIPQGFASFITNLEKSRVSLDQVILSKYQNLIDEFTVLLSINSNNQYKSIGDSYIIKNFSKFSNTSKVTLLNIILDQSAKYSVGDLTLVNKLFKISESENLFQDNTLIGGFFSIYYHCIVKPNNKFLNGNIISLLKKYNSLITKEQIDDIIKSLIEAPTKILPSEDSAEFIQLIFSWYTIDRYNQYLHDIVNSISSTENGVLLGMRLYLVLDDEIFQQTPRIQFLQALLDKFSSFKHSSIHHQNLEILSKVLLKLPEPQYQLLVCIKSKITHHSISADLILQYMNVLKTITETLKIDINWDIYNYMFPILIGKLKYDYHTSRELLLVYHNLMIGNPKIGECIDMVYSLDFGFKKDLTTEFVSRYGVEIMQKSLLFRERYTIDINSKTNENKVPILKNKLAQCPTNILIPNYFFSKVIQYIIRKHEILSMSNKSPLLQLSLVSWDFFKMVKSTLNYYHSIPISIEALGSSRLFGFIKFKQPNSQSEKYSLFSNEGQKYVQIRQSSGSKYSVTIQRSKEEPLMIFNLVNLAVQYFKKNRGSGFAYDYPVNTKYYSNVISMVLSIKLQSHLEIDKFMRWFPSLSEITIDIDSIARLNSKPNILEILSTALERIKSYSAERNLTFILKGYVPKIDDTLTPLEYQEILNHYRRVNLDINEKPLSLLMHTFSNLHSMVLDIASKYSTENFNQVQLLIEKSKSIKSLEIYCYCSFPFDEFLQCLLVNRSIRNLKIICDKAPSDNIDFQNNIQNSFKILSNSASSVEYLEISNNRPRNTPIINLVNFNFYNFHPIDNDFIKYLRY
ncbi:hypothetical protein DLAC_02079 [Tieghemostelium lacteum]|uniref:Uncharacterized protein n=1 Tax=Tieghemostelium lacteum TaxID=361077 RepID=A0A152A4L7_TIELA|nr:hypothetical protein DLAC_02079 [Tieghemostelium lacteum]|eukprot:KYR01001.1 hypothetical protein DLAC_02079 [Tieghemostelium lacteum]